MYNKSITYVPTDKYCLRVQILRLIVFEVTNILKFKIA